MSREMPLSKARLRDLLARYEPGVSMHLVGGYDTGVYFRFDGRLVGNADADGRLIGGRIVRPNGFCSEALVQSKAEKFSRSGNSHGIEMFDARCESRREQLQRWLIEFETERQTKGE